MPLNYTQTQVREIKQGGLLITETRTTQFVQGVAQPTVVEVIVELPKAKFASLNLARRSLATLLEGLDEMLA